MQASVVRISVAPVKSLGLVHPDEIELEPHGVRWKPALLARRRRTDACSTASSRGRWYASGPSGTRSTKVLALTFPDGDRVEGAVELGEAVDAVMYRHPHPSRRVLGPWEDAISEFVGRPLTLLWAEQHAVDRGYRGGTVSLVSRGVARAAAATRQAPTSPSTVAASGCSSRSKACRRTKRTSGSIRRCASVTRRSS